MIFIRNVQNLNIDNTYRSSNLNVQIRKRPSQILDYHKLNGASFHKLFKEANSLKKQGLKFDKIFIGHHYGNEDMTKERQIALDGFPFQYFSNGLFPIVMLKACSGNKYAECMYNYQYRRITDHEITAIWRAAALCRLSVYIPIILGRSDPLEMMVDLIDVRNKFYRAELDFLGFTKKELHREVPENYWDQYRQYNHNGKYYPNTKARLGYYDQLHEVLARYKMQVWLMCETHQQAKQIKQKGLKLANA